MNLLANSLNLYFSRKNTRPKIELAEKWDKTKIGHNKTDFLLTPCKYWEYIKSITMWKTFVKDSPAFDKVSCKKLLLSIDALEWGTVLTNNRDSIERRYKWKGGKGIRNKVAPFTNPGQHKAAPPCLCAVERTEVFGVCQLHVTVFLQWKGHEGASQWHG